MVGRHQEERLKYDVVCRRNFRFGNRGGGARGPVSGVDTAERRDAILDHGRSCRCLSCVVAIQQVRTYCTAKLGGSGSLRFLL